MDDIIIDEHRIPFSIRRSFTTRSFRLQMRMDRPQVTLTAPRLASEFQIKKFLDGQMPWLEKKWEIAKKRLSKRRTLTFEAGELFYYYGEPVKLVVHFSKLKRPGIKVRKDEMIVTLHEGLKPTDHKAQIKKTIEGFYREKAEEAIRDRLDFFKDHYHFKFHKVTFRNQKSRWGSCSHKGNLNFNWRLIMAPIEVIDYVVVHEMCHLKEMNHSSRFWKLVEETQPDYKKTRKWLKENDGLLALS